MLKTRRASTFPIHEIILNRWSPRAMTGESIEENTFMSFFEAARWAPSAMNNQLTRFVYAKRETSHWDSFFNLLVEGNQGWCATASALVIVISRKISFYKDHPQVTHTFEAGLATENLMLEATSQGFVAHAMGGFDHQKAHNMLRLDESWEAHAMIALGVFDEKKSKELKEEVSDRKPLSEIVFEGEILI